MGDGVKSEKGKVKSSSHDSGLMTHDYASTQEIISAAKSGKLPN